jgi:hypothetical protein
MSAIIACPGLNKKKCVFRQKWACLSKTQWGSTINIPSQQVTHDTDQDTLEKKKFPSMSNDYRVLIPTNATCFFMVSL